jgi:hypothetical protein
VPQVWRHLGVAVGARAAAAEAPTLALTQADVLRARREGRQEGEFFEGGKVAEGLACVGEIANPLSPAAWTLRPPHSAT